MDAKRLNKQCAGYQRAKSVLGRSGVKKREEG
jgi:hypothetical protein